MGNTLRRIVASLLILTQLIIPGCDFTGPVEDEYTFKTPLGEGSIKVKREGGPLFGNINLPGGGCLWFTSTTDPNDCVGDAGCITVPAGGASYQVPGGANVFHVAGDCSGCPCEPKVEPETEAPSGGRHWYVFGSFITKSEDRSGFSTTVLASGPWVAQRAYERLRDQKPFDGTADVDQYIAIDGERRTLGFRDWRVAIRDDHDPIADVHVFLDGQELPAHTVYNSGDWGHGAEVALMLSAADVRSRFGGKVHVRIEWKQGGAPRSWDYRAIFQ